MDYVLTLNLMLLVCVGVVNTFQNHLAETAIEFVYYPQRIQWSAARLVCQSIGGDLATLDSDEVRDYMVQKARDNYGTNIFIEEYWVGLVQLQVNERFWVADCTNLTFTTNYVQDFESLKMCYRHKRDHIGQRRECTQTEAFLCQVPSSQSCNFVSHVDSEILSVELGMMGCDSECMNDPECWAAVKYVPDNCIKLAFPGYGVESLTMSTKFCFNVTLNETTVTPDISGDSAVPDATCGNFTYTINPSLTNTSSMTSLSLPICDTVTLTQTSTEITTAFSTDTTTEISIETMTETATEMLTDTTTEISTETATETTTEISIETMTETATEMLTDTTTEISTQTATETTTEITIDTMTEISTSTITDVSTSIITTTVVSTQLYTQNITLEKAEEVAAEIVKNLTIDPKSTSSQIRRLTSADDKRQSSKFVGYIGVIFVTAPLTLMVLSDVRKLFFDFRAYGNI